MYRKGTPGWIKYLDFLILDIVCLHISYVLSFFAVFGISNPYGVPIYRNMIIAVSIIDIIVIICMEVFKDVVKRGGYKELVVTVRQVVMVILFTVLYFFIAERYTSYNNSFLCVLSGTFFVIAYTYRMFWKRVLLKTKRNIGRRSLLIVTTSNMFDEVLKNIEEKDYLYYRIVGIAVIDKDWVGRNIKDIQIVANGETLLDYVCKNWVDEVFLNVGEGYSDPLGITRQLSEMGVVTHNRIYGAENYLNANQFFNRVGEYFVITSTMKCISPLQLFVKRSADIFIGLFGCIITLIIALILAPIIKIKSPGPLFFSQKRVGENGKIFKMYKFRSMYIDAEEKKKELEDKNKIDGGLMFKMEDDPRIIGYKKLPNGKIKKGIGHFIRVYSIDEFPQFFNVLKGDMSLVGTRPPTVQEWERYELHHRARLSTRPGMTGLWQVSGRNNVTDFEEVVRLDRTYIRNWTIGLDCKILLKTILVVLKKEGSM